MNAEPDKADPFGELMTRRIKAVPLVFETENAAGEKIERRFEFEIRESSYGEAKPLLAEAGTMDGTEFGQRLIGLAVYLEGVQLTYERVLKMTPATIGKLMELVPAIVEIYRLGTPDTDEADAAADVGGEASPSPSLPAIPADGGAEPDPAKAKKKG